MKIWFHNDFVFLEENKRARKRQRTDSVEKLKTFENKVVIEIKLPDEIKTYLSRDWHLINNENKVKVCYLWISKRRFYIILAFKYSLSTNCWRNYEFISSIKIK